MLEMKMRMRRALPILVAIAMFISFTVLFFTVNTLSSDFGPEKIKIDYIQNKYHPVDFNHKDHQTKNGISCVTCHHTESADFTSGTTKACRVCHTKDSEKNFKSIVHIRCLGCHKKLAIKEEADAPTGCNDCHKLIE